MVETTLEQASRIELVTVRLLSPKGMTVLCVLPDVLRNIDSFAFPWSDTLRRREMPVILWFVPLSIIVILALFGAF